MSLESEQIIAHRRGRQRLLMWRAAAVALGLALLLALIVRGGDNGLRKAQIARVDISGMITDDFEQQKLLKKLAKSDSVKAVVLRINSPGGTTAGGEALYLRIRALSEKKPVVAVFGTLAASAAYMAGLGADRIYSRGSSITGSVGVLVQWPDVTGLMDKVGVTMEEFKSGPLKATPSPFRRDKPENLAPMKEMVADTFEWFLGLVKERRKIEIDAVPGLREGRIYTGRVAQKYGLVDAIGGEEEAISWLETEKSIKKGLPVVDHEPARELPFYPLASSLSQFAAKLGLGSLAALLAPVEERVRGGADGLLSLWRPQSMAQ